MVSRDIGGTFFHRSRYFGSRADSNKFRMEFHTDTGDTDLYIINC
jgi:hypothetical protein